MDTGQLKYYVGSEGQEVKKMPLPVYSDIVCEFLDELSAVLRHDVEAKQYPDILTFAFWCRHANIARLKEEFLETHTGSGRQHMGRGIAFHIAPSNVPVNFAFSFAFGLLAGCGNVVRVSEKEFSQTKILCRAVNALFEKDKYLCLREQNQIISYGHDQEINSRYSSQCDVRVVWGGDATIEKLRESLIKLRCMEIVFADRYSFAVFSEQAILKKTEEEFGQFIHRFYNDTYLMDQNACSSPHMIIWVEPDGEKQGRKRFFTALAEKAKEYELAEKKVMDKYTILCEQIAGGMEVERVDTYGNRLYVAELSGLTGNVEEYRGRFGLFYEMDMDMGALSGLVSRLSEKTQTCVVDGIAPEQISEIILKTHSQGIDRIVPVGKAMDIGVYWDGYDIIGMMSRKICMV